MPRCLFCLPPTAYCLQNNYVITDEVGVQMVPNAGDGNFPQFGNHKEIDHENSMAWFGTSVARDAR